VFWGFSADVLRELGAGAGAGAGAEAER
jgi:hypothetical protein